MHSVCLWDLEHFPRERRVHFWSEPSRNSVVEMNTASLPRKYRAMYLSSPYSFLSDSHSWQSSVSRHRWYFVSGSISSGSSSPRHSSPYTFGSNHPRRNPSSRSSENSRKQDFSRMRSSHRSSQGFSSQTVSTGHPTSSSSAIHSYSSASWWADHDSSGGSSVARSRRSRNTSHFACSSSPRSSYSRSTMPQ